MFKTTAASVKGSLETGHAYRIKVEVNGIHKVKSLRKFQ